jgi:hypothetical protein
MLKAGAALAAGLWLAASAALAGDAIAPAETALFMTDHLRGLAPPARLRYDFSRSGSLEVAFSDQVEVDVEAGPGGARQVVTRCLSEGRRIELPALDFAQGNPALLCFLERDIRQMERLTGGKANYFRKRIRLALAEGAEVRNFSQEIGGRPIAGREIRIAPYSDDPLRQRFERYAAKYYVFRLSDDVPGGIVELDAVIPAASAGAAPLQTEALSYRALPAESEDRPRP